MSINTISALSILIPGIPGILLCIFIIVLYNRNRSLQVREFLMIVYLCSGDLVAEIAMVTKATWYFSTESPSPHKDFCVLLAYVSTLGNLITFFWTFNICYVLNASLLEQEYNSQKTWRKALIIGFGIPFLLATIPLTYGAYNYIQPSLNDANCFLSAGIGELKDNLTRLFCFYIPLWSIIIYNTYIVIKVIHLRIAFKKLFSENSAIMKRLQHLFLYPLILLCCFTLVKNNKNSICRVGNILGENNQTLEGIQYLFTNSMAISNSLAYSWYGIQNLKNRNQHLMGSSLLDQQIVEGIKDFFLYNNLLESMLQMSSS